MAYGYLSVIYIYIRGVSLSLCYGVWFSDTVERELLLGWFFCNISKTCLHDLRMCLSYWLMPVYGLRMLVYVRRRIVRAAQMPAHEASMAVLAGFLCGCMIVIWWCMRPQ